jgi:transcriptional regulator with XRE-family HTH domain
MPESINSSQRLTFSSRLKSVCKDRGVTIYQVSKITGISEGALRKYEQGISSPSAENVFLLCKFLKVSSDYLIGLEAKPGVSPIAKACEEIVDSMGSITQEWALLMIEGLKEKTDSLKRHNRHITPEFIERLEKA